MFLIKLFVKEDLEYYFKLSIIVSYSVDGVKGFNAVQHLKAIFGELGTSPISPSFPSLSSS